MLKVIKNQIINNIINTIITISYITYNTIKVSQLTGKCRMKKCFFLRDNAVKHMTIYGKVSQPASVMHAYKISSLLNVYNSNDL